MKITVTINRFMDITAIICAMTGDDSFPPVGEKEFHQQIFGESQVSWDLSCSTPWVSGLSTSRNFSRVTVIPTQKKTRFEFCGTRHALRHYGNEAGQLFALLFGVNDLHGEYRALDLALLNSAKIEQYESLRTDAPWWEYGLEHPAIVRYRRMCSAAGRICPKQPVYDDGEIREDYGMAPVPTWSGVEYRRLKANGAL